MLNFAAVVSMLMLSRLVVTAPVATSADITPALSGNQVAGAVAESTRRGLVKEGPVKPGDLEKRFWKEFPTTAEYMEALHDTPPQWNVPPPPSPPSVSWYDYLRDDRDDRVAQGTYPAADQATADSQAARWLFYGEGEPPYHGYGQKK